MSVIGRLDGQVDAVLISPIGKRRGREEATGGEADTAAPDAQAETTLRAEDDAEKRAGKRGEVTRELPVWLL